VDRFEYRGRRGRDGYLWDAQGYVGGDLDKFWFKSEGEGQRGERAERIEVQALWSHAIRPFFDLQMGVLHDFAGRDRTSAVIGIQGIAPYGVEIDTAAFLSTRGDLTARAEVEIDQRITQRLILQPRAEIDLAAQDIPGHDVGRGLDKAELGLRVRYEFAREFAPYIGVIRNGGSGAARIWCGPRAGTRQPHPMSSAFDSGSESILRVSEHAVHEGRYEARGRPVMRMPESVTL